MNTLLNPVHEYTRPTELRRLSILDRLALHGGLALIRWAQRDRHAASPEHPVDAAKRPLDLPAERRALVEARHRIHALG
ncbi:MAG: hypothetical protein QM582_04320 [Micropruina sp.]|uniref:hypothetical protein n=1 Tax=Micropruina sp. TaxID=2737536 RepID=UPI0039E60AE6